MQIRQKLTYQFVLVVALFLFLSSIAIYYFSADYRKDDFYSRLFNKAYNTAKLLIEVEEVDIGLLKKIDSDKRSLPEERITILDSNGKIAYSTDTTASISIDPEMITAIHENGERRFSQNEFEILGFLFPVEGDNFIVMIGAVDIYGLKKLRNLRTVLITVFGVSIVLVFISGWVYAGRALRPISGVIDQVDNITITSLDLRVDEGNSKDEIAKLANTFNNMLDRLETAFKMQRTFIANASHELRTPLTTITGQLDVALMNERTIEEYKQILRSVLDDMKNLNTVSNRLLLLAQTSSESSGVDFKPMRVDDTIWQSKTDLVKSNPEYKIHVFLDPRLQDDRQLTIFGNEQLMKTAISNLIENGCKYARDRLVRVSMNTKGNQIILRFTDSGIGIHQEDLHHIFEPFYRGKNALTTKGHGIGLSLVQRIVNMHRGAIHVSSRPEQGTTFTVSLPLTQF